ncbi:Plug domain-containing protein [Flavicella sediminum]|uniref:Plug domain-containing protein n=1 Tax=Flavicella sediminum TaxID=2585141 RepID=UPI001122081D|nr:Plug domain-containing protein [Flavicella sediminum]
MKKSLLLIALFIAATSFTLLNNQFSDTIIAKLEEYATKNYPEKIYVQTDKPYYSQDETIWFTSYLVNGITHKKTEKSRVVHVEFINAQDSILDHKKLYIDHISGSGDFKISKNLAAGKYLLRAYTNDMRNKNELDFFQKEISILSLKNPDSTAQATIAPKKITAFPRPNLRFFPEGGYLLEGIANKVGIEIKDKHYKNSSLSGTINDNEGNEIFNFKTLDFGLGVFSLTPEFGKTYYASIYINGAEEQYPLPKALQTGHSFSVTNNGNQLLVSVNSTKNSNLEGTFLVGHQRGQLIFKKFQEAAVKQYSIMLPTTKIDDGVVNITLFNKEGNPTAERLVYVNNPGNNLKVVFKKEKEKISPRQPFKVAVAINDDKGNKVASVLSMAVRDMAAVPQNTRTENIKTWLLLNSDLRGQIENPGYFFEKENDIKRRYLLDLVMLTHGWRKFTWNELLNGNIDSNQYPIEKGLFITGTTKMLKRPYSPHSSPTRLTFMGKQIHQEPIQQSDSLGRFKFGPFVFTDSIPTLLEARMDKFKSSKRKSRDVVILVDKAQSNSPAVNRSMLLKSNTSDEKQLAAFLKISKYIQQVNFEYEESVRQLDEVIVRARRKTELEKREEEMNDRTDYGYASNRQVIADLGPSAGSQTAFEVISFMNGVSAQGDTIYLRRAGIPQVYLDGMQVDADMLRSFNAEDIAFVDILTGAEAATFSNAGNGIIAVYSNTGNVRTKNIKRKPGIIDFQAEGFYTAKKFYAPDHINGIEESMKADIRTTLHWEPFIRTAKETNSEVSFFSCDTKGDYIIEVEGISDEGVPVHGFTSFTVD